MGQGFVETRRLAIKEGARFVGDAKVRNPPPSAPPRLVVACLLFVRVGTK